MFALVCVVCVSVCVHFVRALSRRHRQILCAPLLQAKGGRSTHDLVTACPLLLNMCLQHNAPRLLSKNTSHFSHTQIKYVVEVAKALARIPSVARVDLLTRQICDPAVDASYGEFGLMN